MLKQIVSSLVFVTMMSACSLGAMDQPGHRLLDPARTTEALFYVSPEQATFRIQKTAKTQAAFKKVVRQELERVQRYIKKIEAMLDNVDSLVGQTYTDLTLNLWYHGIVNFFNGPYKFLTPAGFIMPVEEIYLRQSLREHIVAKDLKRRYEFRDYSLISNNRKGFLKDDVCAFLDLQITYLQAVYDLIESSTHEA